MISTHKIAGRDSQLARLVAAQGLLACTALLAANAPWWPAIILFPLLFLQLLRPAGSPLRRLWAWALLLPFILWWVVADGGERWLGIPQLLFFIPAWYFLVLSYTQLRSLGQGGSVGWAQGFALVALVLAGWIPGDLWVVVAIAYAVVLMAVQHRQWQWQRNWQVAEQSRLRSVVAWITVLAIAAAFLLSAQWGRGRFRTSFWQGSGQSWQGQANLKGFSLQTYLGSFAEHYDPSSDFEVVMRIWSKRPPPYLRGALYAKYQGGNWSVSGPRQFVNPIGRVVDHKVFIAGEIEEIDTPAGLILPVMPSPGVYFTPVGSRKLAALPESLEVSPTGIFYYPGEYWRRGWYFYDPDTLQIVPDADDLQLPKNLQSELQNSWAEIKQIYGVPGSTLGKVEVLRHWFVQKFSYTLHPRQARRLDPLASFLQYREGFCEHFASMGVLLLRQAGVPARLAKGFALDTARLRQAPFPVRRGDAHAWVEAWLPTAIDGDEYKWQVVEFTPPDARHRVLPSPEFREWLEWWSGNMQVLWHGVRDGKWREWADLLGNTTVQLVENFKWKILAVVLIVGLFLIRRSGAKKQKSQSTHAWSLQLTRVEQELAGEGIRREPWETVSVLLRRVDPKCYFKQYKILVDYCKERFAKK